MSYPVMTRNLEASSTSTGMLTFTQQSVGFSQDAGVEAIYVADTPLRSFHVQIGGAATVVIEGNNWDPDTAGDWYSIASTTTSTEINSEEQAKFVRARVSAYTSGDVDVKFVSFG